MNHPFRFAIPLIFATFCFGCTALRAPLTCPEKGGLPWTEIASEHFVLGTDLDAGKARALSSRFEDQHAGLAQAPGDLEPQPVMAMHDAP